VEVQCVRRGQDTYVLARSRHRRQKERAIRRRQLWIAPGPFKKLSASVQPGRLKTQARIQQRDRPAAGSVGRGHGLRGGEGQSLRIRLVGRHPLDYRREKLRGALARDGAYLLLSDRMEWGRRNLWTFYIQLTRAEEAFRAMKSNLLLRPMHRQLGVRVQLISRLRAGLCL